LNDKYLKYIVPCPCNYYLIKKCTNKKLVFTLTEENEITLENNEGRGRARVEARGLRSEGNLGKIVQNSKK
jgi:hypothetical protein